MCNAYTLVLITLVQYAHIYAHAQPNTDIVIGAADGIGFFVNDRFASLIGREVGWRLSDGQE